VLQAANVMVLQLQPLKEQPANMYPLIYCLFALRMTCVACRLRRHAYVM